MPTTSFDTSPRRTQANLQVLSASNLVCCEPPSWLKSAALPPRPPQCHKAFDTSPASTQANLPSLPALFSAHVRGPTDPNLLRFPPARVIGTKRPVLLLEILKDQSRQTCKLACFGLSTRAGQLTLTCYASSHTGHSRSYFYSQNFASNFSRTNPSKHPLPVKGGLWQSELHVC